MLDLQNWSNKMGDKKLLAILLALAMGLDEDEEEDDHENKDDDNSLEDS